MGKTIFKVVIIFAWIFVAILLMLCVQLMISLTKDRDYYPEDGIWYCDELQMQLAFDGTMNSCKTIGNEIMPCTWVVENGSTYIGVYKQNEKNHYSSPQELVFYATYVRKDDETFVVRERDTDIEYVFCKMPNEGK